MLDPKNFDTFLLPLKFTRTFDDAKFKIAIEEAQKNDQIGETYPQIFTRYTSLHRAINNYQGPAASLYQHDFQGLAKRDLLEQQNIVKKHLMSRLKVELNDQSNLYKRSLPPPSYLFDLDVIAQVSMPSFTPLPAITFESPQPALSDLLPSRDLREFRAGNSKLQKSGLEKSKNLMRKVCIRATFSRWSRSIQSY